MSLFSEINWTLFSVVRSVTFFGGRGVLTFNCLREALCNPLEQVNISQTYVYDTNLYILTSYSRVIWLRNQYERYFRILSSCSTTLHEDNGGIETPELTLKSIPMATRECYHGRVCIDVRYSLTCFRHSGWWNFICNMLWDTGYRAIYI